MISKTATVNDAKQHLIDHGIRPSVQRLAIMKYLMEHRTHPTVDKIYNDLRPSMPTLSRTTVYNTLEVLVEHDAVLELSIDSHTSHYDGATTPHAHFRCRRCGAIIDVDMKDLALATPESSEFTVEHVEISYTGLCTRCINDNNQDNNL